jgi:glycopeptide antibiotics resistance protein
MITALFMVEFVQLIGRIGVFDIDDIILRLIGVLIGYFIWKTEIVQKNLS